MEHIFQEPGTELVVQLANPDPGNPDLFEFKLAGPGDEPEYYLVENEQGEVSILIPAPMEPQEGLALQQLEEQQQPQQQEEEEIVLPEEGVKLGPGVHLLEGAVIVEPVGSRVQQQEEPVPNELEVGEVLIGDGGVENASNVQVREEWILNWDIMHA